MKRHFSFGFKALAACAMSAMLAVSCYDDSALWDEIEGLEERVAALEDKLNSEVATLNSKIGAVETAYKAADAALLEAVEGLTEELDALDGTVDGYIKSNDEALKAAIDELKKADAALADVDTDVLLSLAKLGVVSVEKDKDGKVVITFVDESTLEIANESGVVTIVDGKWAVVVDGEVTVLDAPVLPGTDLTFKVDPETNILFVSYDGGKTWESTFAEVEDAFINVVTGVKYEEGDEYVTLVVGDAEYEFPLYNPTASLVIGRADFFLRYNGTKTVSLLADGMKEYYVMNQPDGWKASIDGTTLTVTAPTKAAVEIGAAKEGLILVHGTTDSGLCKVAKVAVSAGPGLTLEVAMDGTITIENSYTSEKADPMGRKFYSFDDFIIGAATPEIFLKDPKAYLENYNHMYQEHTEDYNSIIFPSAYNIADDCGEYVEGEYETDIVKASVNGIYRSWTYRDCPYGTHNVIWIATCDSDGKPLMDDLCYAEYVHIKHNVEVQTVTHSDITLKLDVDGASSYLIGFVAESDYINEYSQVTFDEYMTAPMGGLWTSFVDYGALEALGVEVSAEDLSETLNLSDVYDGKKLAFNKNYKVWVMPVFDHLKILDEQKSYPAEDYWVYDLSGFDYNKNFLPYVLDVTTNDIVAGGECATALVHNTNYQKISVQVNLASGTDVAYCKWYSTDDYAEFNGDTDAIMNDLFTDEYYAEQIVESTLLEPYIYGFVPGVTEQYLATVSVGTDGKYGELVVEKFGSTPVPVSGDIAVELDSFTFVDGKLKAVFNVTGEATMLAGYNITANDNVVATFKANVAANSETGNYTTGYQFVAVEEGVATVTFDYSSSKKDYCFCAYTINPETGLTVSETVVFNIAQELSQLDQLAAAAAYGGTVTLTENVTLTELLLTTKNMTIDLGGNTLTFAAADGYPGIKNTGTLTVKNGKIVSNQVGIQNNGTLTINCEMETVENAINNVYGGKTTIQGGSYKNTSSERALIVSDSFGDGTPSLTINGGTFESVFTNVSFNNGSKGAVNAGTFKCTGNWHNIYVGGSEGGCNVTYSEDDCTFESDGINIQVNDWGEGNTNTVNGTVYTATTTLME